MRRLFLLLAVIVLALPAAAAAAPSHGRLIEIVSSRATPRSRPPAATGSSSTAPLRVYGKPINVTGVVSLPKGKAPKNGWPVISYDHGTTGIA